MLRHFLPLLFLLLLPQALLAQHSERIEGGVMAESCPVARPYKITPVVPLTHDLPKAPTGSSWFGAAGLWVLLPVNGVLKGLPLNTTGPHPVFERELSWWWQGHSAHAETWPGLIVTGERLGPPGPPLVVGRRTLSDTVVVGFPTFGCWQITGRYEDEELTFVLRVMR